MKLDRLLALTRNPELLADDESQDLETLVQEYPYFSAAQLLLTVKYKQQNTSRFNRQLQKAAAHLPDKNVLAAALHEDLARMQQLTEAENPDNIAKEEAVVVAEVPLNTSTPEGVVEEAAEIAAITLEKEEAIIEVEVATEAAADETAAAPEVVLAEAEIRPEVSTEPKEEVEAVAELAEVEVATIAAPVEAPETIETTATIAEVLIAAPDEEFLTSPHDRLSWFRFFAGKPLREQPADVLEELYLEHMSGDFLQADSATLPELKSELKAVINHEAEVAQNKNLEEEIRRLAYESISDEELPASETLAAIYESQKDYKKALRIYQKLMLKFPDRMTYFAGLIASTKEKLNN